MFLIDKVKREEKKRFSMLLESNSCIFSRYPFKTLDLWSDIGDYTLQNGGSKIDTPLYTSIANPNNQTPQTVNIL